MQVHAGAAGGKH